MLSAIFLLPVGGAMNKIKYLLVDVGPESPQT